MLKGVQNTDSSLGQQPNAKDRQQEPGCAVVDRRATEQRHNRSYFCLKQKLRLRTDYSVREAKISVVASRMHRVLCKHFNVLVVSAMLVAWVSASPEDHNRLRRQTPVADMQCATRRIARTSYFVRKK